MSRRNLPPLAIETAYIASDFQRFDYLGSALTESKAILRLHLINETTIDLPSTDEELKRLLIVPCDAFGPDAIAHLKSRGWV